MVQLRAAVRRMFHAIVSAHGSPLLPMMVGGVIVGTIGAAITYPLILYPIKRYQQHHGRAQPAGEPQ